MKEKEYAVLKINDSKLFIDCRRLYVEGNKTFVQISTLTGVPTKTLYNWANRGMWREEREILLRDCSQLHTKLYSLISKYITALEKELSEEQKISTQKVFSVNALINSLTPLKEYEASLEVGKIVKDRLEIPEELIYQIETKFLGLNRKRILPPVSE